MERFLRNSDSFNPQLEPMNEKDDEETPVLLERFIKDTVAVVATAHATNGQQTLAPVSTEEIALLNQRDSSLPEEIPDVIPNRQRNVSFGMDDAVRSSVVEAMVHDDAHNDMSMHVEAPSVDVSLSANHPPSSDTSFDGHHHMRSVHNLDGETASGTADEPRVLRLTEADMLEMAAIDEASIGNAPPSDRDEALSEIGELVEMTTEIVSQDTPTTVMESHSQVSSGIPSTSHATSSAVHRGIDNHIAVEAAAQETLVEPLLEANVARVAEAALVESQISSELPTAQSPVNRQRVHSPFGDGEVGGQPGPVVEGFDYDKDAPSSPVAEGGNNSFTELPLDVWSPQGKMHISPLHPSSRMASSDRNLLSSTMAEFPVPPLTNRATLDRSPLPPAGDTRDIPPEIVTHKDDGEPMMSSSVDQATVPPTLWIDKVFEQIQSSKTSPCIEAIGKLGSGIHRSMNTHSPAL